MRYLVFSALFERAPSRLCGRWASPGAESATIVEEVTTMWTHNLLKAAIAMTALTVVGGVAQAQSRQALPSKIGLPVTPATSIAPGFRNGNWFGPLPANGQPVVLSISGVPGLSSKPVAIPTGFPFLN